VRFQRPARSARALVAVELTPLIDVVFLLLIFFMVSTTFVRETALGIRLPNAQGDAASREPGDIEVQIGAAGDYVVDGHRLAGDDVAALQTALATAAQTDRFGATVVVAADAGTRHDAVVRVLDAARRAGLTDVSILTDNANSRAEGEDGH